MPEYATGGAPEYLSDGDYSDCDFGYPSETVQSKKQTNVFAVIGLIFTLICNYVRVYYNFLFIIYIVLVISGLILSVIGLRSASKLNGNGKSISIIGITLAMLELLLILIYMVVPFRF